MCKLVIYKILILYYFSRLFSINILLSSIMVLLVLSNIRRKIVSILTQPKWTPFRPYIRLQTSWMAALLPIIKMIDTFKPLGRTSQIEGLTLFGIHFAKWYFLLAMLNMFAPHAPRFCPANRRVSFVPYVYFIIRGKYRVGIYMNFSFAWRYDLKWLDGKLSSVLAISAKFFNIVLLGNK